MQTSREYNPHVGAGRVLPDAIREDNAQLRQRVDAAERQNNEFRTELESLKTMIQDLPNNSQYQKLRDDQSQIQEYMAKQKKEARDENQQLRERVDALERGQSELINEFRTEIKSLKETVKDLRDNSPYQTITNRQSQISAELDNHRKKCDERALRHRQMIDAAQEKCDEVYAATDEILDQLLPSVAIPPNETAALPTKRKDQDNHQGQESSKRPRTSRQGSDEDEAETT
ncbi:hypothetical protein NM208_g3018 [Fusarium decemcellulare]|uniref:Uncharacterized protein n=1 Tax=Fusarium decemcellulare TaxID=57161 RepID=A0ACC1SQL4_9HYPO|nr:hypothetical protein NM208_g3018 [Fusarium decemcellulare]